MADDIIIAAASVQEHDAILRRVLERARDRNIKLNWDKLQLRVNAVKYLGTIISEEGIKPDPAKVEAISNMPIPTDKAGVRRLLGMVNFLANHIPNMSVITEPLRQLVKADTHFQWADEHHKAIDKLKAVLTNAPILQYFDPTVRSTIQADASQHGLGACLLQKGQPIAYASRSLNSAECNYAQIEKELLAIVFACEKFHHYVYGFPTNVQSDHKPLESIFLKPMHQVSPRLQRMLLKLQKYHLTVKYTKGKDMHVADALSRAYLNSAEESDSEEIELAVHRLTKHLPVSEARKTEFQLATQSDSSLQQVKKLTMEGWPSNISNVPESAREFWKVRDQLHVADGLIFTGERLVVPTAMKMVTLQAIHEGHMGIERCKQRARSCVYWPLMNEDIEQHISKCEICNKFPPTNRKEPMISHETPSRPWEKVGVNHFTLCNQDYLIIVDYYSKYPEVVQVHSKTAQATIKVMMSVFSRHGIPNVVIADNMPFNSVEFQKFAKEWDFTITTSSPNYPQSNGLIERNIQTVKRLFRKANESNTSTELALLEYRNTPISGINLSPSQLLMSRRLRSNLPMMSSLLSPQVNSNIQKQLEKRQQKQRQYYNRGARSLLPLSPGDAVRYKTGSKWQPAIVVSKHTTPRSYIIRATNGNILRRNRRHLKRTVEAPPELNYSIDDDEEMTENLQEPLASSSGLERSQPSQSSEVATERVSRYGRHIRVPERYKDATDTLLF